MIHSTTTGGIEHTAVEIRPDKRWLGILLCAFSALLVVAIGVLVAGSLLIFSPNDREIAAEDQNEIGKLSPAAGPVDSD
jgi:hypothetical protein